MRNHRHGKSPFKTKPIRNLSEAERLLLQGLQHISTGERDLVILSSLPKFVSLDKKDRYLFLHKNTHSKIVMDHGNICYENLIITSNDWDYLITNIKGNPDRINLIKKIPNSHNFLVIGAIRDNGFFILTHFETLTTTFRTLKNLLGRGDTLDRSGRTPSDLEN